VHLPRIGTPPAAAILTALGGKAKNDTIDAHKIAVLLRGGMVPQAYVYPAAMRATRDFLRRRMSRARKRAALLTHVQNTHSQYNLPAIGKQIAYKANRDGVAERFADPAVQKSLAGDLALLGYYEPRRRDVELAMVKAAKQHHANALYLLQTVPGIGKILRLVLLYEIHDIQRFPSVQAYAPNPLQGCPPRGGRKNGAATIQRGPPRRNCARACPLARERAAWPGCSPHPALYRRPRASVVPGRAAPPQS
jgi:transposase